MFHGKIIIFHGKITIFHGKKNAIFHGKKHHFPMVFAMIFPW
jgi:hypothetical protein